MIGKIELSDKAHQDRCDSRENIVGEAKKHNTVSPHRSRFSYRSLQPTRTFTQWAYSPCIASGKHPYFQTQ